MNTSLRNNISQHTRPTDNEMATSGTSPYLRRGLAPWFLILLPMLYFTACGPTTETIVVGGPARAIETEEEEEEVTVDEELRVLKIGEVNRIRSFDPLFAINTATKRTIQLLYEGLVRYDENDEIVPAAAQRWEVSDDSLTYTFYLRDDLYFHDDESFTQGRGRRVNSRDVVRVFERMAARDVPSNGAELFMNTLQGFEGFYLEQREIYFADDREIRSISGIEATNETTVEFQLLEPNHRFIKKMASPYAVIYPSEPFRFRDDGLHQHAVGTGPFAFDRSIGDSLHIFVRNGTYYARNDQGRRLPRVHRVELLNITDETRLYSQFTRERLNMIVDLGPRSVHTLVDENNELKEGLRGMYRLESRPNPDPIILRYNAQNRFELTRADAVAAIRHTDRDMLLQSFGSPSIDIPYKDEAITQLNVGRIHLRFGEGGRNRLIFAFNQDHLPRILSGNISESMDDNLRIELLQRRAFSRDIFLYLDYLTAYYPDEQHVRQPQEILRIMTDRYMLFDKTIEGVLTNSLSWWINLNRVQAHDLETGEQAVIYGSETDQER